jgi:neutral ceramidase
LKFIDIDHELLQLAASFQSPPGRPATKTSSVARRVRGVLRQVNKPRFVSAFCQSNCGDVSPNTLGAFCTDTGLPCDFNHSTCGGKNELCYGRGPGYLFITCTLNFSVNLANLDKFL